MRTTAYCRTRERPIGLLALPEELRRNRVYRTCGVLIAAALLVAVLDGFLGVRLVPLDDGLYWEEAVMVLAFGTSWLVKRRDLWPWPPAGRAQQAEPTAGAPTTP
jgi:hypothetical protein